VHEIMVKYYVYLSQRDKHGENEATTRKLLKLIWLKRLTDSLWIRGVLKNGLSLHNLKKNGSHQ
jgi:hypothetical protein